MTTSTAVDEPVEAPAEEKPQTDAAANAGRPEESDDSAPTEDEAPGRPSLLDGEGEGKTDQADGAGSENGEAPEEQTVEYDLTLPEGAEVEESTVASIKEFAAANKLSQDAAQALLDRDVAQGAATQKAWNDAVEVMHDAVVQDKELGGDHLPETRRYVLAALEGHDDLKADLKRTGYENHIGLVRLLAQFGKAKSEPNGVSTGDTGAHQGSGPDPRVLWPKSPEMWGDTAEE